MPLSSNFRGFIMRSLGAASPTLLSSMKRLSNVFIRSPSFSQWIRSWRLGSYVALQTRTRSLPCFTVLPPFGAWGATTIFVGANKRENRSIKNIGRGRNSCRTPGISHKNTRTTGTTETKIMKMSDDPPWWMGNFLFRQALHFNWAKTGQWDARSLHVQLDEWSHATARVLSTTIKPNLIKVPHTNAYKHSQTASPTQTHTCPQARIFLTCSSTQNVLF